MGGVGSNLKMSYNWKEKKKKERKGDGANGANGAFLVLVI